MFFFLFVCFLFALVHNIFAGCNNIERVQHYVFPMAVGRSSCQIGYQLYLLAYLHLMSFSFFLKKKKNSQWDQGHEKSRELIGRRTNIRCLLIVPEALFFLVVTTYL